MKAALIVSAFCLSLVAALPAQAFEAFTKAAFQQAQESGANILVHVHAPWCPTCKAQEPGISQLERDNPMLKVFRVDFDSQKDVVKEMKVSSQSTLIAFKGKMESSRMVGVTDPMAMAVLIK